MQSATPNRDASARPYLVGFVLALALTALPFGLVAARLLPPGLTFIAIAVAAVVQIAVHLRFFLRLGLRAAARDKLLTLCFAAILIAILMGGSIWIMFDLHYRMMGGL